MSDPFDPTTIVIAKAQAADRAAEDLATERHSRAVKRLGRRALSQDPHSITEALSGRAQRKAARDYAEAWWQAVRAWETAYRAELVPRTSIGSGGAGRMTPIVGNYGRGQAMLPVTEVRTPIGWVSESRLGKLLGEHDELVRLRSGAGLVSLIHPNGRGWRDENAPAYAAAVLRVAADLGDDRARAALQFVQV